MCGITGITTNDKQLIKDMSKSILHRGPDQSGIYTDKHVSLGHQRLSIIDLSEKGKQPMSNENYTVWITFNGEIYNYLDLKPELEQKGHQFKSETDTEVIVHLYEEYGEQCVEKLWGDFAFAIYDAKKKKIFLARDRIGVKPLYYHYDKQRKEFSFASEIKALLANNNINREINQSALRQYLTYRYVFDKNTIFNNIYRILPGECLTFDIKTNTTTTRKYWDVNPSNKTIVKKPEAYYKNKFLEIYEDSVKRRLMSDVPLGVYLSGGIDSSSIITMMHALKQKNPAIGDIKTFSIGFDAEQSELPYSREVSEYFNTNHHEFIIDAQDSVKELPKIIWHCDEPLADPALIPNYFLSQEAKQHVTVVLTGDGGDETFAGYEQAKFMMLANKINKIPFATTIAKMGLRTTPTKKKKKIFKYSEGIGKQGRERAIELFSHKNNESTKYTAITGLFDDKEFNQLTLPPFSLTQSVTPQIQQEYFIKKQTNLLNKILYFELKTLLPENMLMKSDKMTMTHAIEARVPLLDHRITELSYQMPTKLKLNGLKEKYILKKSMQDKLPASITQRKKQRFYVPIDHWIRDDLQPIIDTLLSTNTLKQQGYFDPAYVQKIMTNYKKAPLFYARQLWTLITFQIWHAEYIDGIKPQKIL